MAEATPQQIANAAQVHGFALAARTSMKEDGTFVGIVKEITDSHIAYYERLLDEYGVVVSELPQTQVEAAHDRSERASKAAKARWAKRRTA